MLQVLKGHGCQEVSRISVLLVYGWAPAQQNGLHRDGMHRA